MKPETIHLHQQLIRLTKGMIKAWEEWLAARACNPMD